MVFKIKPILTPRQLTRAKFTVFFAAGILICLGILSNFVDATEDQDPPDPNGQIQWNGEKWKTMDVAEFERGRIVYFSKNTEVCNSSLLIPGVATLSTGLLATAYGLALIYLFLGISIVAEIFMESIEKITSKQVIVNVIEEDGSERQRKLLFWNATVANLTLMALGSSAPEILLAVLETCTNLGSCPGELGASTIVGSAAFNLLVISAISIYAVNEDNDKDPERDEEMPVGVKRIYDMRVFAITCTSSLWAYIWLWIVLLDQEVEIYEGFLTFAFFFILVILAYGADKYTESQNKKNQSPDDKEEEVPVIEYSAYEIYKEMLIEQRGNAPQDDDSQMKRDKMKRFLKQTMKTDQIDKVSLDELKKIVEGEGMISRIKYRKQVNNFMTGKRPVIAKYEKMKLEHAHADQIDENLKNELFGFQCLHYSVSESSGKLTIVVQNKTKQARNVYVSTVDGDAKAGEDYLAFQGILEFQHGQHTQTFDVGIKDDDNWEPDEDFFVQLYDPDTKQELVGQDTRTRVTIIDDDKPGQICFQDTKGIKVSPTDPFVEITVIRKNGSDGKVTVDYETIQLGNQDHVALDGVHFKGEKGQLVFENQETEKTVKITILQNETDDQDEQVDNAFGFQLSKVTPMGAKLSKKSFQIINIVTDLEQKKKADAYAQLIAKLDAEEEKTWGSQFITACMLHPTKGEDGEIQDIEAMDGVMHFLTIGWKIFFAFIPPAHYYGGVPCFFISLTFIGIVTFVVGEFANLFGCVLGIKPGVTAITFVALGTSLPDTFASMQAAQAEKYADAAVGNVTGSNSVNVFLGLGLPWVIATLYEYTSNDGAKYYVPAGSLGFSVVVFCVCAITCVICLLFRRWKVKGELGGSFVGRVASAIFLCCLWLIYIMMSIIQAYEVGGSEIWAGLTFGIKAGVKCPERYQLE